jgi:hypothetical protein
MTTNKPIVHLVIPDVQAKPDVDFTFLRCLGNFIVKKKPDVIVCIGDFADMESLSTYDRGLKSFEGRSYQKDIWAAREAMDALLEPLFNYNKQRKANKKGLYTPRMVLTLGNHEHRIDRAINEDRKLDGLVSTDDLPYQDWEVIPFLEVITIDGIAYSHYFTSGVMGRPITSAQALLTKKHMSCFAGHQQGRMIAYGKRADGKEMTSIICGSCLHPDHKVLTADLRYIPMRDLKVGDKLVSFDEGTTASATGSRSHPRRYKTGTVEALRLMRGEMFDVTLSSGKVFRVTKDHLWFTKNTGSLFSWKTTEQLRKTNPLVVGKKGGGTRIVKMLDEFEHDQSWESGWLAGMYCGEGSLYHKRTTGGSCMQLSLSQSDSHNPATCKRIESALKNICGVNVDKNKASTRAVNNYRIKGGTKNIATVLGTVRPPRMLDKFIPEMLGGVGNKKESEPECIVSILPVGEDDYLQISIDAKTMIVEGYGHHNCYEHSEAYLGAQGNNHYRGFYVLHDVHDGAFDEMAVSIKFLKERYDY